MKTVYDNFFNEEDLDEHAIAVSGAYNFGDLNYIKNIEGSLLSKEVTELLTKVEFKGKEIFVFKQKFIPHMVLIGESMVEPQVSDSGKTYDYKDRYLVIGAVTLYPLSKLKKLGYNKKVFEIKGVEIRSSYRGAGYGKLLYSILVKKLNYILVGDQEQYDGARKMWVSLSKDDTFKVDIIDIDKRIIIEKDVNLKDVFDEHIWVKHQELINKTLNQEKDTVGKFHRLVLTKVE